MCSIGYLAFAVELQTDRYLRDYFDFRSLISRSPIAHRLLPCFFMRVSPSPGLIFDLASLKVTIGNGLDLYKCCSNLARGIWVNQMLRSDCTYARGINIYGLLSRLLKPMLATHVVRHGIHPGRRDSNLKSIARFWCS